MRFASRLAAEKWLCALPRTTAAASSRYPIPVLAFPPLRFRTYSIDSIGLTRLVRAKTEVRDSDYRLSDPFARHTARRSMCRAVRDTAAPFASDFPGVQLSRPPWMSRIQRIPQHRVPWTEDERDCVPLIPYAHPRDIPFRPASDPACQTARQLFLRAHRSLLSQRFAHEGFPRVNVWGWRPPSCPIPVTIDTQASPMSATTDPVLLSLHRRCDIGLQSWGNRTSRISRSEFLPTLVPDLQVGSDEKVAGQ